MPSSVDLHFPQLTPLIEEWWRGTHEPGVPPHLTLLYPWVDAVGESDIDKVREIASATAPFEVSFTAVAAFAAGAVYLRPEPDDRVRELMARFVSAFPDAPLYDGAIADPTPHLTIRRAEPGAATETARQRIAEALGPRLPVTLPATAFAVMEQDADGFWETIHEVALTG